MKQRKEISLPTVKHDVATNELIETPVYESKTVPIEDEYDTDEILGMLEQLVML